MVTWILVVLALYLVQVFLVPILRFQKSTIPTAELIKLNIGSRDNMPEMPALAGRAERALNNLKESLPFFITFALLILILGKVNESAITGAAIYTLARIAYVPSYLSGAPAVRTLVWVVSAAGLIMMLMAIVSN